MSSCSSSTTTTERARIPASALRPRPNILITGTPGTGKTVTASLLAERLGLRHVCVGDVAALHQCYEGRDEELDTYILDEDRLLDILEATLAEDEHDQEGEDGGMAVAAVAGSTIVDDARDYDNYSDELRDGRGEGNGGGGGIVMDYHASDLFPERWFDLVLVLRCDTATLFDRLTARGYSERKRSENVTAEIMNVALEEAREAYDPQIVIEVNSNTLDEMEDTIERVRAWMDQWILDNHHRQREGIHKDSSGNNHSNSE